jgi:hypothetical protein
MKSAPAFLAHSATSASSKSSIGIFSALTQSLRVMSATPYALSKNPIAIRADFIPLALLYKQKISVAAKPIFFIEHQGFAW